VGRRNFVLSKISACKAKLHSRGVSLGYRQDACRNSGTQQFVFRYHKRVRRLYIKLLDMHTGKTFILIYDGQKGRKHPAKTPPKSPTASLASPCSIYSMSDSMTRDYVLLILPSREAPERTALEAECTCGRNCPCPRRSWAGSHARACGACRRTRARKIAAIVYEYTLQKEPLRGFLTWLEAQARSARISAAGREVLMVLMLLIYY
jgi:hypothetical protein